MIILTCAALLNPLFSRCWGVVELVTHLTLDQEDEGSSPSSPALSQRACRAGKKRTASSFSQLDRCFLHQIVLDDFFAGLVNVLPDINSCYIHHSPQDSILQGKNEKMTPE